MKPKTLRPRFSARANHIEVAGIADICYSKGKKIILVPDRKENGKWVCRITIPEHKDPKLGGYQDDRPEEYETGNGISVRQENDRLLTEA